MPDAELFDPADVTWTRVSPRLAGARRVVSTTTFLLLAVAAAVPAVVLGRPALAVLPVLLVLAAGLSWWTVGRQVAAWGYAERDDDLLVRSGVAWKRVVVVPYGRMQYIDVQAGPLDRAFTIARVQLHTASASSDASIPGLPPEEAARLRDRLASRGQTQLAGL
jgi:uncharacterized protein